MLYAQIGETFSGEVILSLQEITEFARLSGDFNPLHHDPETARRSRFGAIIASGPQTAAHFMGLTASYFSKKGAALGLEFDLQFKKAAFANESLHIEWKVVKVEWKEKLGGELIGLAGQMTNPRGEVVLAGTGTVLVCDRI